MSSGNTTAKYSSGDPSLTPPRTVIDFDDDNQVTTARAPLDLPLLTDEEDQEIMPAVSTLSDWKSFDWGALFFSLFALGHLVELTATVLVLDHSALFAVVVDDPNLPSPKDRGRPKYDRGFIWAEEERRKQQVAIGGSSKKRKLETFVQQKDCQQTSPAPYSPVGASDFPSPTGIPATALRNSLSLNSVPPHPYNSGDESSHSRDNEGHHNAAEDHGAQPPSLDECLRLLHESFKKLESRSELVKKQQQEFESHRSQFSCLVAENNELKGTLAAKAIGNQGLVNQSTLLEATITGLRNALQGATFDKKAEINLELEKESRRR